MTAHNNRKASNSMNESSNRIANTLWTPVKAGMLAVVKPVCREANYSRTLLKSEMTVSERTIGTS
jgi:hypothetical protein